MQDLSDHPFSPENIAYELGGDTESDRRWYAWVAEVERQLGHVLDGNDENGQGEGYSLDEAYDCWENGDTPAAYVAEIKARPRYRGRVE